MSRVRIAGVAALVACLLVAGCEDPPSGLSPRGESTPEVQASSAPRVTPKPTRPATTIAPLLRAASGGDGDSWKDTAGREYRLGLVNAPESGECYGGVATRTRRRLVAGGFRAKVYAHDSYGRGVSLVTLADGTNLNVLMARQGLVNDRYLADFRHENPSLARQLDVAFAAAKRVKAGLWGACVPAAPKAAAPQPFVPPAATSSCHPDYATCIAVKGDGSGNGAANDLDCGDIGKKVALRQVGVDPYRLDSDADGFGCDSY